MNREKVQESLQNEKHYSKTGFWWLSFSGEEGFLGACIVQGNHFLEAVMNSKRLEINPGGEVWGTPMPENMPEEMELKMLELQGRLMSLNEMKKLGLDPGPWPDN